MIDQLRKTYEHFPKQSNEHSRQLSVINHELGYDLRLVIYFNKERHASSYLISFRELETATNSDMEIILWKLCKQFAERFGG